MAKKLVNKKYWSLAPMLVMVPYMIYVFNNRFKSDYERRDELIALKAEKDRIKNVNAKNSMIDAAVSVESNVNSLGGNNIAGERK